MKQDEIKSAMDQLKPKRPLTPDFTEQTLLQATGSKQQWLSLSALRHAPALAIAAALILLSGSVYAATHWPEITATFGGKTELPSGNTIIGVDTSNCNYFQVQVKPAPSKEKVYYEIKKGSPLSQDQIVDMVKGICEENLANSAVNKIVPSKVIGMSGGVYDITGITKDSISVQPNKYYQAKGYTYDAAVTYRKMAPDLLVYDGSQQIAYSDLKAGDTVMLVAKDEHALPSETDPNNGNHWADPDLMTILAIVKVPHPTASPLTFYLHLGKDFVRTEPCSNNSSGFCRVYDFH